MYKRIAIALLAALLIPFLLGYVWEIVNKDFETAGGGFRIWNANHAAVIAEFTESGQLSANALVSNSTSAVGTVESGEWNADTITVPYGGTGLTTVPEGALLFGLNTLPLGYSANLTYNGHTFSTGGSAALDGSSPTTLTIADNTSGGWTAGAPYAALNFSSADATYGDGAKARIIAYNEDSDGRDVGLAFYTKAGLESISATEALRISSTGYATLRGGLVAGVSAVIGTPLSTSTVNTLDVSAAPGSATVARIAASGHQASILIDTFRASTNQGYIISRGARGTHDAPANTGSVDRLFYIGADGFNASAAGYQTAAVIQFNTDGEVGTSGDTTDIPGRLTFWTTPDGSATPAERLRITNAGNVLINAVTATPAYQLVVGGTVRGTAFVSDSNEKYKDKVTPLLPEQAAEVLADLSTVGFDTYQHKPSITFQGEIVDATPANPEALEIWNEEIAKPRYKKTVAGIVLDDIEALPESMRQIVAINPITGEPEGLDHGDTLQYLLVTVQQLKREVDALRAELEALK